MDICVAKASVWRCALCFLFPFIALAAYINKAASVGIHDFSAFLSSLAIGQNALSVVLFVVFTLVWILLTWPRALAALRSGDCAVSVGRHRLWLYGENVERSEIATVELARGIVDIELCVHRTDGSKVVAPLRLLSPKPDAILAALREQGL